MSVVVEVEELSACRKQLKIEVPAPAVEAEMRRVTQEYRKRAKIAGFRQGKVPLELVESRYGDEIRNEVLELLVPRYWHQAQAEKQLDVLLPPSVSDVEIEPGQPLTFTATVEVRPEIELDSLDGFELPDPTVEASDEEVERALEDLRRGVGEWAAVERPAGQGDRITGTLTEVGAEDAAGEGQEIAFEVGDERVWEELSLAATGLEAGRETRFTRRETTEGEERERSLLLAVSKVEERELPTLDDELAAKIGNFDSVDELRSDLAARLTAAKRRDRDEKRERALLTQLRERHPLDLPEGVIEHETETMLREYAGQLQRQGVDLENAGIDWKRLSTEIEPRARERVHERLLIDAAADKLAVEVGEGELEARLADIAKAQGKSTPMLRRDLDRAGGLEELRGRLRRHKTVRSLLGEKDEEAEGSAPATSDAGGETNNQAENE